jgi:hypothetical protein
MAERTVAELRDLAKRVLDDVALRDVVTIKTRADFTTPPVYDDLDVLSEYRVRGEQQDVHTVLTFVQYDLKATPPAEGANRAEAWHIRSEWMAEFKKHDAENLERYSNLEIAAFAMVMAPPTLHPYVRAYVQELTALSPYPPFTMDLLTPIGALPDEATIEILEHLDEVLADEEREASEQPRT